MFLKHIFRPVFAVFFLSFLLNHSPAFASRPGGGPEGPDQCTVMGAVTQLKENNTAVVRLSEPVGSTTQMGCYATGAAAMAEKKTLVTISLDVQPVPVIAVGDVVFVNIRSDRDVSLEIFTSGEFSEKQLLDEVQIFFDNRTERFQIVYAIKSFIGVQHVIDEMVPLLIDADKEKRLAAALMLILLADNKQPVPPDMLQQALRIGLLESRQTAVGSSIKLYPGDRAQVVNVLIGLLHDKEVVDPFATIVAVGEMGEEGARAIPDAIDRINAPNLSQLRNDGDKIFAEAVTKTKAEDKAVKIFLADVKDGKLKDTSGPLAKGMCQLHTDNADLTSWCKSGGAAPVDDCADAVAMFGKFLAAAPNTCTKDADCGDYYFPLGGPECPPAYFLPKASMTDDASRSIDKYKALIRFSCAAQWKDKAAVCSPPVVHPGCRNGMCVDVK